MVTSGKDGALTGGPKFLKVSSIPSPSFWQTNSANAEAGRQIDAGIADLCAVAEKSAAGGATLRQSLQPSLQQLPGDSMGWGYHTLKLK